MTQHNCRPCQGIQTLTPMPIRILAGQKELNFRIGTYAEYFESMLAALGRGRSDLSSNERSVLSYLTARDKDDPSIAMLDAWAVLADVLTFYNERYMNEGFLRTATQASSLYELANIVGYTPRPGLSSSVFLAFEVDEKSSEVLIPEGTPAKSTPIPGSGETPQTFETSVAFVARPGFNRIQTRIRRPQNLAKSNWENIDRIYLQGTGLRIAPNDYITIADNDIADSRLFRVIRVEERTDGVERITVLYFGEQFLSPRTLARETRKIVERFIGSPIVSELLSPVYIENVLRKDGLLNIIPLATVSTE